MNIYVDFDDCLCETARYFSGLIDRMFGLDIPYEKIRYFDLQKSKQFAVKYELETLGLMTLLNHGVLLLKHQLAD